MLSLKRVGRHVRSGAPPRDSNARSPRFRFASGFVRHHASATDLGSRPVADLNVKRRIHSRARSSPRSCAIGIVSTRRHCSIARSSARSVSAPTSNVSSASRDRTVTVVPSGNSLSSSTRPPTTRPDAISISLAYGRHGSPKWFPRRSGHQMAATIHPPERAYSDGDPVVRFVRPTPRFTRAGKRRASDAAASGVTGC